MPTNDQPFAYVRHVDFDRFAAVGPEERYSQSLFDHASGAETCTIAYIRTPVGGGSPAGMHVHDVDQIFFIVSGTMSLEVKGEAFTAEPGSLVVFPAGVPHRNWNAGTEPTVHLAFNTPLPDPSRPFARPLDEGDAGR